MTAQFVSKLCKPSKVASVLDWKKVNGSTLLSLNFHQDRVGIAVASHPSFGEPVVELEPLRITQQHPIVIDSNGLDRFSKIMEEYKVCGVVISWPLQHDTGRMGAACGRVIFALQQMWERSNGGTQDLLSKPFCLWDSEHVVPKQRKDPTKHVDGFGRCASYGKTTTKAEHIASKEQYHEDELTVVVEVWNDFCKEHWPELYANSFAEPDELKPHKVKKASTSSSTISYGELHF
jgi:RNase H-fold protein (predicted Holliday junction resolvase)